MPAPPEKLPANEIALFLDVDGTLLDIADHPRNVAADAALLDRLERTSAAVNGAIALISGRSIADLDRIFPDLRFAAAGEHGAEMRLKDAPLVHESSEALPGSCLLAAQRFAADNAGIVLEQKAAGISLHYRQAPQAEAQARALVADMMEELGDNFRLIEGKMVLEVAPRAHTKGAAVHRFLEYAPFRDRRPVFVGDDVTDEDGFKAANQLNGISIRVGQREDSAAMHELTDVRSVHAWIDRTFVGS